MANYSKNKKHHYTYKTTNLVNGRYYLGMHSTNRLDDGYLGSGKRLYREINKYGRDNFKFEILKHFDSREELVQAEIKLITEEDLKNTNCLNLKPGGSGGFCNEEHLLKFLDAGTDTRFKKGSLAQKKYLLLQQDPKWNKQWREKVKKGLKKANHNHATFKGKKHRPESIQKMKESAKGKGKGVNNSQYGTCWITNNIENKKIRKDDAIPEGWKLGRVLKNG